VIGIRAVVTGLLEIVAAVRLRSFREGVKATAQTATSTSV